MTCLSNLSIFFFFEIRPKEYWTEYHWGIWNAVGTSKANGLQVIILYKSAFALSNHKLKYSLKRTLYPLKNYYNLHFTDGFFFFFFNILVTAFPVIAFSFSSSILLLLQHFYPASLILPTLSLTQDVIQ